jgi:superfamily II DNA or RNA helicase
MNDEFFQEIREAVSPRLWSKGVELARAGRISQVKVTAENMVLQVPDIAHLATPKVTLWLEELDWNCTCGSEEDPCCHTVAAAIFLRRVEETGATIAKTEQATASLRYEFSTKGSDLCLERWVQKGSERQRVVGDLLSLAQNDLSLSQTDLQVDHALKSQRSGILPTYLLRTVLALLREEETSVFFEGAPARTSDAVRGICLHIADTTGGLRVQGVPDPEVTQRFQNGVCRVNQTLHPLVEPSAFTPEEQNLLRQERFLPEREVPEFFARILPQLTPKVRVHNRTRRQSARDDLYPHVQLLTRIAEPHMLVVRARIAYGDPVCAVVESGSLQLIEGDAVPMRDLRAEAGLAEDLRRDLGLQLEQERFLSREEALIWVKKTTRWRDVIHGAGVNYFEERPTLLAHLAVETSGAPSIGIAFSCEDKGRSYSADPQQVLRAWRQGESLVPLLEGGWAPLPTQWLARYGERLHLLFSAQKEQGAVPACLLPDLARLCEELEQPVIWPVDSAIARLTTPWEWSPPSDLCAELRTYQEEGVRWLALLQRAELGALLADDMGLGKTLQAICILESPSLVIVPTSVLYNWEREIETFRPGLPVMIYHGKDRRLPPAPKGVVLTTYALARLDSELLRSYHWRVIVLDEAQQIKNPHSQVAQAVFQLQGHFRVALTGTPVENRLEDLWSQFHFLNRGLLGGFSDFSERYQKLLRAEEALALEGLRTRIAPFFLRRLKSQVAPQLPQRTDSVWRCQLTPEETDIYQTVHLATKKDLLAQMEEKANTISLLEVLLRLRQAACHPGLLPGHHAATSSKVEALVEALENCTADGHKALVFSQWTSFLNLIEQRLTVAGLSTLRIDGSTRNRQEVVDRFQTDPQAQILLLSLKAAGVGLTLTAADHVFIMDPWWNPAVEEQAADRAHRIGQDKPVMVVRMIAKDTVEERILLLKEKKRALADAALGEGTTAAGLTREDLLELLR